MAGFFASLLSDPDVRSRLDSLFLDYGWRQRQQAMGNGGLEFLDPKSGAYIVPQLRTRQGAGPEDYVDEITGYSAYNSADPLVQAARAKKDNFYMRGAEAGEYDAQGNFLGVGKFSGGKKNSAMDYLLPIGMMAAGFAPALMGMGGAVGAGTGVTVGGPMSVGMPVGTELGALSTGAVGMGGGTGLTLGGSGLGLSAGGLTAGGTGTAGAGFGAGIGTSGFAGGTGSLLGPMAGGASALGALSSGGGGSGALSTISKILSGEGSLGDIAGLAEQFGPGIAQLFAGFEGRSQADRLQGLMELASPMDLPKPGDITSVPGYQAGLEAVQRSMSAQGYQGSGNMMAALAKYGENAYNQYFDQRLKTNAQRLLAAGMQAGPASAGISSLALLSSGFGKLAGAFK